MKDAQDTRTSIVEHSSLRPMLDNHGQGTYPLVNLDICPYHASVLQGHWIVHVHIAG